MTDLILTPQQISVSLEDKDGELRLDSRIMADGFGIKNHTHYRNNILVPNEESFAELGVVLKTTLPSGEIVWYLNQAQVNFAGTLARNTEKAVKFKLNLVKAFEIAKQIIPAQSERLRELELELELTKAKQLLISSEHKLIDTRNTIVVTCPQAIADRILGVSVVKETEYVDRTILPSGQINDGVGITYIQKRYGFKSTKEAWDVLESVGCGKGSDIWKPQLRAVESAVIDRSILSDLDRLIYESTSRQTWISESRGFFN